MSIIQSFREMSPDALGKIAQGGLNDFAREVIQEFINDALENEIEDFLERASRKRMQFNSEDSALIVLARVCEDHNNNAKPLKYLPELSEEEKERIGFKI